MAARPGFGFSTMRSPALSRHMEGSAAAAASPGTTEKGAAVKASKRRSLWRMGGQGWGGGHAAAGQGVAPNPSIILAYCAS